MVGRRPRALLHTARLPALPAHAARGAARWQSLPFVEPRVFGVYAAFEQALYASLEERRPSRFTREGAREEQGRDDHDPPKAATHRLHYRRPQSATMTHMEHVGIREMRQNLSRYLRRARGGESFVITDRGSEVARLGPAPGRASAIDRLVAERGARRAQGDLLEILDVLPEPIPGPPSSDVLDELRAERL